MEIYEIKVTPEIARLRHDDAGERRVQVVEVFSAQPRYYVGDLPREIREDVGLLVRPLEDDEARRLVRQGAALSSRDLGGARLARVLLGAASRSPAAEAATKERADEPTKKDDERAELLERLDHMIRDELDHVHKRLVGRKPHGNAADESVRDAIRAALEAEDDEGDEGESP